MKESFPRLLLRKLYLDRAREMREVRESVLFHPVMEILALDERVVLWFSQPTVGIKTLSSPMMRANSTTSSC